MKGWIDLYGILGVARSASQGDVKEKYYELAEKYHPDRTIGQSESVVDAAAAKFADINAAYQVLGEKSERQRYDMQKDMASLGASYKYRHYLKVTTPEALDPCHNQDSPVICLEPPS